MIGEIIFFVLFGGALYILMGMATWMIVDGVVNYNPYDGHSFSINQNVGIVILWPFFVLRLILMAVIWVLKFITIGHLGVGRAVFSLGRSFMSGIGLLTRSW